MATAPSGLAEREVQRRRAEHGLNVVALREFGWSRILLRQFSSSFVFLLLGAAGLAFLLREPLDGGAILFFVVLNAALGFVQELRSEQTAKLLNRYVVARAKVRRNGAEDLIPAPDVVPGDLVLVETGDVLPADLRFIQDHALQVDEATLTGESAPVQKTAGGAGGSSMYPPQIGLSGTTVVNGWGEGIVVATGARTIIGDVSRLVSGTERVSGFEHRLARFSRFLLWLTLITLALVFLAHVVFRPDATGVTQLLIFSIALAVSVIPEALPVVMTFSLSRGAARLAKRNVVVKRLSAIEDLGSIDVLCTDKTGTLTENNLTVADIRSPDRGRLLIAAGLAASLPDEDVDEPNNAFDRAVWRELSPEQRQAVRCHDRRDELPFDPVRRRNSVVVAKDRARRLIVRGAPEAVLGGVAGLPDPDATAIHTWIQDQGRRGRRVIAVAEKAVDVSRGYTVRDEESGLTLLGCISFVDSVKESAKEAIAMAHQLGVRIVMLTGDDPDVAAAVAIETGLIRAGDPVLTGASFSELSSEAQHATVAHGNVFARVTPQQKHRILTLLREHDEVGFLGEGMNDAPALKAATVALVVNDAADVAREAADIILLKKDLKVIVEGMLEGRRVFANTIKYIRATLASNIGNFYAIAIASLFVEYLPMLPIQILLVNLLSDVPMIAIATDRVDRAELVRPKSYRVREIALFALVIGGVSTIFDFLYFGIFSPGGAGSLQTHWFMGSILTELLFLFSARTLLPFFRSVRPSRPVLWLTLAAALLTITIPFTAFGRNIFHFAPPDARLVVVVVFLALLYFLATELTKLLYVRYTSEPSGSTR